MKSNTNTTRYTIKRESKGHLSFVRSADFEPQEAVAAIRKLREDNPSEVYRLFMVQVIETEVEV